MRRQGAQAELLDRDGAAGEEVAGQERQLYFLIGMDAFKDIAKWYKAEELLRECDFIVAARPEFSLADMATSLPAKLRPRAEVTKLFRKEKMEGPLVLPGAALHLLRKRMKTYRRPRSGRRGRQAGNEAAGARCGDGVHPERRVV